MRPKPLATKPRIGGHDHAKEKRLITSPLAGIAKKYGPYKYKRAIGDYRRGEGKKEDSRRP
jgi:hypothetical protein